MSIVLLGCKCLAFYCENKGIMTSVQYENPSCTSNQSVSIHFHSCEFSLSHWWLMLVLIKSHPSLRCSDVIILGLV